MPVRELDPNTRLDPFPGTSIPAGAGTAHEIPADTRLIDPNASTTATGLAGSVSRGATRELAFPLATAAAGSVVPGIGTGMGFAAGTGIELAANLYNAVAPHL